MPASDVTLYIATPISSSTTSVKARDRRVPMPRFRNQAISLPPDRSIFLSRAHAESMRLTSGLTSGARLPIGGDRTLLEGILELTGKVPAFLRMGVLRCAF
ncbi:hypothetical protein GCM10027081_21670 [Cupriavidus yeoncheonensis]